MDQVSLVKKQFRTEQWKKRITECQACGMCHIATKGDSSHLSDNITELAHRLLYDDITKKQKQ